jgi:mRNA interferase MazF
MMRRGDIYIFEMDPVRPAEIGKRRPCVIVSDEEYNLRSTSILIMPISTYPPDIDAPEVPANSHTGLKHRSSLLPLHIRAVAKGRAVRRIGRVPESVLSQGMEILDLIIKE